MTDAITTDAQEIASFRSSSFEAARRHTRLVRALRLGLPAAGLLALVAIVVAGSLGGTRAKAPAIADNAIEDGAVVMDAPQMHGVSDAERPYTLSATRARQRLDAPDVIEMDAPIARFEMQDGEEARLSADGGRFDNEGRQLTLQGAVELSSPSYELHARDGAEVDMSQDLITSEGPVDVRIGEMKTKAQGMRVLDGGERILFDGGVRSVLTRNGSAKAPRSQEPLRGGDGAGSEAAGAGLGKPKG